MNLSNQHAPGWPGGLARWTSSAKSAVGTALSNLSSVWFTISHGIFNKVFYPWIDQAYFRDTKTVIYAPLKVETPAGNRWHRYNDDGYGEHEYGSPFDGNGIARAGSLLTSERGHYELAAGHADTAKQLLIAMESFANENDFISEHVWEVPTIPKRGLYPGRPSGSAMPVGWAHAEYLKLRRSLDDGRFFELPPQPVQRYLKDKTASPRTGLEIQLADLPTRTLRSGSQTTLTFIWEHARLGRAWIMTSRSASR